MFAENISRIKRIIVVSGSGNTGKSTVLRMLCGQLLNGKPTSSFRLIESSAYNGLSASVIPQSGRPDVMLAVKHNTKLIGVGTEGDSADSVLRNFMFLAETFPDQVYDCVYLALRQQKRTAKKVGDCTKSLAQIELEELVKRFAIDSRQVFLIQSRGQQTSAQQTLTNLGFANDLFKSLGSVPAGVQYQTLKISK